MKIVLDTNCLVNVIMPGSYNNDIWQAFRASKYVLCVTNEILFEYHEILAKRYNSLIANTVLKELMETPNVEHVNPTYRFNLIKADPDDKGGVRDVDNIVEGTSLLTVPSSLVLHISSATTATSASSSNTTSRKWPFVHSQSS